jgi:hypothetical protein
MKRKPVIGVLRLIALGTGALLVPKCPMCIAGYVLLATGVAISLPVAQYLRLTVLLLAGLTFTFYLIREFHLKERAHGNCHRPAD